MLSSTTEGEEVLKPQRSSGQVIFKAFLVALLAVACLIIGISVGAGHHENQDKNALASEQIEVENLVPFVQLTSLNDEDSNHVEGSMVVSKNHRESFTFESQRDENTSTIKFECDKATASKTNEMDGWCGFDLTKASNDSKTMTLSRYDGLDDTVILLPQDEDGALTQADITVLQEFLGSKTSEYFVALTFKLAALGKTGANGNVAYAQMHGEAQWIFTTAIEDEHVQVKWDLGESLNGRRLGLHETSIVEDLNRHLMGDDAADDVMMDTTLLQHGGPLEWLEDHNHGRMLGSCGSPYNRCDNRCFGMCGPGCSCWSWACGGCGCYDGCRSHDYYCSCKGWWHPYCIAAVWALIC